MAKNLKPYDLLWKGAMKYVEIARDILETTVPKEVLALLQLDTMRLCPEEHHSPYLGKHHTDVLYAVDTHDGRQSYFYIHAEAQRTPDHWLPWRMHLYEVHAIEEHRKRYPEEKYLPLVYQLVVYNGEVAFHSPRSLLDLVQPQDQDLWSKLWYEPFHLIDLSQQALSDLPPQSFSSLLFFLLWPDFIDNAMPHLQAMSQYLDPLLAGTELHGFADELLEYLLALRNKKKYNKQEREAFDLAIIKSLPQPLEEHYMNLREHIEQRGLERGVLLGEQKGLERGVLLGEQRGLERGVLLGEQKGRQKDVCAMHRKGLSIEKIADLLNLSQEKIQQMLSDEKLQ